MAQGKENMNPYPGNTPAERYQAFRDSIHINPNAGFNYLAKSLTAPPLYSPDSIRTHYRGPRHPKTPKSNPANENTP